MRNRIALGLILCAVRSAAGDVTNTGAYTASVVVDVPHYYGLEPKIDLSYRSDAGNGQVGVGWRLDAGSTIRRSSSTYGAAHSDLTDVFFVDGRELVTCLNAPGAPSCLAGGTHAFRTDTFEKVVFDPNGNTWTITSRDGAQSTYTAQLGDLTSSTRTATWALAHVIDTHNHHVDYGYFCDGPNECYLQTISYGDGVGCSATPDKPPGMPIPGGRIRFNWQPRPDPISVGIGLVFEQAHFRLRSIDVGSNGRARVLQIGYLQSTVDGASLVQAIDLFGDDAQVASSGDVTAGTRAPTRKYTAPAMTTAPTVSAGSFPPAGAFDTLPSGSPTLPAIWTGTNISNIGGVFRADNDGDGRVDVVQAALDNQCTTLSLSTRLAGASTDQVQSLTWTAAFPDQIGPNPVCGGNALVGDLDGDGRSDLVFLIWHPTNPSNAFDDHQTLDVVTLLSNGDGTWATPSVAQSMNTVAPTHTDISCAIADVNGDGRDDLACIGSDSLGNRYVNTAVSAGDGRLLANASETLPIDVGTSPQLATVELNGDGRADIVVIGQHQADMFDATSQHWNITTGLSLGSGWYEWESQDTFEPVITGAVSIAGGDIDGDGHGDAVWFTYNAGGLRVTAARNVGTGSVRWGIGHQDVLNFKGYYALADADGDGASDVMLAEEHDAHDATRCNVAIPFPHPSIWSALSHHDGTFGLPTDMSTSCGVESQLPLGNNNWQQFAALDVNGDGKADWLQTVEESGLVYVSDIPSDNANADPRGWRHGDLDGDGRQDWVYVGYANPGFDVYAAYAQPDGSYVQRHQTFAPSGLGEGSRVDALRDWFVIDADGDGKSDVVILDDTRGVVVTLLSGSGGFTETEQQHFLPILPGFHHWTPLDFDGDGRTDLVNIHMGSSNGQAAVQISSLRAFTAGTGWITGNDLDFVGTMTDHTLAAFRAIDFDGDGLADLVHVESDWQVGGATTLVRTLRSRGDGTFVENTQTTTQPYVDSHQYLPIDFNGDGRTDLARVLSGPGGAPGMTVMLSRGDGNFGPATWLAASAAAAPWEQDARFVPGDLDHDGQADFYQVVTLGSSTTLFLMWNTGTGFATQTVGGLGPFGGDVRSFVLGDRDGDGSNDLTRVASAQVDDIAVAVPTARVTEHSNGLGGRRQIDYATNLGKTGNLPAGMVQTVVTQTRTLDDTTGLTAETTSYGFDGATYDHRYRRLLGYITETTTGPRAATTTTNTIDNACGARPSVSSLSPLFGLALLTTTTTYWPETTTGQAPFSCLVDAMSHQECEGSTTCRTIADETKYDIYGNVVQVWEKGDLADPTDDRLIVTPVYPNTTAYVVSRPAYRNVSAVNGPGWILVEATQYIYDHNSSALMAPGARAELTMQRKWNDHTGGWLETNYSYDPQGNLVMKLGPATPFAPGGEIQTYGYDCAFDRYVTLSCDAKFCKTAQWDFRIEGETTTADQNHESTVTTYDPLGRETRVDFADGGFTTVDYPGAGSLGTPGQHVHRTYSDDSAGDGVHWTDVYLDGLAREVKVVPEGAGTVETTYDLASERPARTSTPHGSTAALWTQTDYDAANRAIRVTLPDGKYRRTTYATGALTQTDENGAQRIGFVDGFGRLAAIEEDQRSCQANSDSCVVTQRTPTYYGYDVLDRLLWIRDAAGHYITNTYDSLSRRLTHCTPDAGCTTDTYYDDGMPLTEADAAGNVRTYHYDIIGRPTLRTTATPTGVVTRTTTYGWDNDPTTGQPLGPSLGRLTQETDGSTTSITRQPKYGVMGRVAFEHDCIDGRCLDLGYNYDHAGRISRIVYPDANGALTSSSLQLSYGYADSGWLKTAGPYASFQYDPDGRPTVTSLGSGAQETRVYDPLRRWMNEVSVNGKGGSLFHELLGHDSTGRVSSATFTTPHQSTSFVYSHDDLGRLVNVSSSVSSQNATYRYDPIGNRIGDPFHGTLFHNDPNHVHAVTSTQSGASFAYDPKGQLIHSNVLHVTWNEDGNAIQIDDVPLGTHTVYAYDGEGNRVIKRASSGQTTTFGPLLEVDTTGQIVRYIEANGELIARIDHNGIEYLHRDHLGSVRTTTDPSALPLGERSYGAWGEQLSTFGSSRAPQRYGGVRADDENGLEHLGARYYDPTFGQMLSPDTEVPDIYTPQSLHTYAYVMNDPASFVDPSGHEPDDGMSWLHDPAVYPDPASSTGYGLDFSPPPPPPEPEPPPPEPAVYSEPPMTQAEWLENTNPDQFLNDEVRSQQGRQAFEDRTDAKYIRPFMRGLTQAVRVGSAFYPYLFFIDIGLDHVDEEQGWGSTAIEGPEGVMLMAVAGPEKLEATVLSKAFRAAKAESVVLKVAASRKMIGAERAALVVQKYEQANRLLREHAKEGVYYRAFESMPYDKRASQQYVKDFTGTKTARSNISISKAMPRSQIDEFISRFWGGPQMTFNQHAMPADINMYLGSREWSAVQRQGIKPGQIIREFQLVWVP